MAVPCGKCLACLSNKRKDWSIRLMQEFKVSKSAKFVTLTYSDRFCPKFGVSLRHLQLYIKRLRKICKDLRYYAVGEYGEKTHRPHYHAILFNANADAIRSTWSLLDKKTGHRVPIGIVHIGTCSEASVAYTLKYIVQSREKIPEGLNKTFSVMSRGYGLGLNYLTDEMVKWHRDDDRVYIMRYGEKLRLPRFYKDKIWPASDWSDWKYRREKTFKKARKEAEQKEKLELYRLEKLGYSAEKVEVMRNLPLQNIKQKVAFSQKL